MNPNNNNIKDDMTNKEFFIEIVTTLLIGIALFFLVKQWFNGFYRSNFLNMTWQQFAITEYSEFHLTNNIEIKKDEELLNEFTEEISIDDFNWEIEFLWVNDRKFLIAKDVDTVGVSFINHKVIDWINYLYTHSNNWNQDWQFVGDYLFRNVGTWDWKSSEVSFYDTNSNKKEYQIKEQFEFQNPEDVNIRLKTNEKVLYTCVPWTNWRDKRWRILTTK